WVVRVTVVVAPVPWDLLHPWADRSRRVVAVEDGRERLSRGPGAARTRLWRDRGLLTRLQHLCTQGGEAVPVAVGVPAPGSVFVDFPVTVVVARHPVASVEGVRMDAGIRVVTVAAPRPCPTGAEALRRVAVPVSVDERGK